MARPRWCRGSIPQLLSALVLWWSVASGEEVRGSNLYGGCKSLFKGTAETPRLTTLAAAPATAAAAGTRWLPATPHEPPFDSVLLSPRNALQSRAYRGLWGSLFQQQHSSAATPPSSPRGGLHEALSSLQTKILARLNSTSHHSPLEELFAAQLNFTLSLLGDHASSGGGIGGSLLLDPLEQLHSLMTRDWGAADPQQLAALALVQGWTLGAVLGGSSGAAGMALGSGGSSGGGGEASGMLGLDHLFAKQVAEPSWASFRPHICLRLQNFGNAEGYRAAVLGASPCTTAPGSTVVPSNAAASSDVLRWGGQASFLLDCSHGQAGSTDGSEDPTASSSSSALSNMLQAAGKAAAASMAAALNRTTVCRLGVSSDGGGGGAALERAFERPLLGAPKLDALHIRICNMAPSTLQYPAALARGTTIRLSGLKLNGRPLLTVAVQASQASAADGCLVQLYRFSSRATRAGYVLSGWLQLAGGSGSSSSSNGSPGSGGDASSSQAHFGVGEMASLELSLGEYSQLGAAASRLLGGVSPQAAVQRGG